LKNLETFNCTFFVWIEITDFAFKEVYQFVSNFALMLFTLVKLLKIL